MFSTLSWHSLRLKAAKGHERGRRKIHTQGIAEAAAAWDDADSGQQLASIHQEASKGMAIKVKSSVKIDRAGERSLVGG